MTRMVESLIMPPGNVLLLMGLALYFFLREKPQPTSSRRYGLWFLVAAMGVLYITSIQASATFLVRNLEQAEVLPPLGDADLARTEAQAIVILGYGRYVDAPDYGGDTVSTGGLARLRYGARLHRKTGLPILVSGGRPYEEARSEAALMKDVLENEFQVPVRWLEEKSRNTLENALFTQKILVQDGINHVLLVTHARDISRAMWSIEQAGLTATPAPTLFKTKSFTIGPMDWMPGPAASAAIGPALHEYVGKVYYWLKNLLP
ncbi:MAG: YdcF family protein [Magnetococcales bacterium]|nr:YdcF family protein [Magnetococcales bacterium]